MKSPFNKNCKYCKSTCCSNTQFLSQLCDHCWHNCVSVLVDSGAALNLINHKIIDKPKIPTLQCVPTINLTAINDAPIGFGITQQTSPLTIHIGLFHVETIIFYVVDSCKYDIILCPPWLSILTVISWSKGELTRWSAHCQANCLFNIMSMPCFSTTIESPEVLSHVVLPSEYSEYSEVLNKCKATRLSPHRPWDCAI